MTVNNDAIATLKGRVDLLAWMIGFNLALTVAVLFVIIRLVPHA